MAPSTALEFQDVSRFFGDVKAVDGVTFEVRDGEFFTMLGPSGSGKTTCLRMIAGFEQPSSGRIILHGDDVSHKPPFERDVNTVFQDYALFPHMSVLDNVCYGLMIKKVSKAERERRAREMLAMVRLEGMESRRPNQLSGGQRQRVALARALVNRPRVLLLDEPLGALDLKLRQQMQLELKSIQHQVGITFVFVTHDQEEAMTMSDRIAVFNHGQLEQVGSPEALYERPATAFVAGFIGTTNLLAADVAQRLLGVPKMISIRPERIRMSRGDEAAAAPGDHTSTGTVGDVMYLGPSTRYGVNLDAGVSLIVIAPNVGPAVPVGTRVQLAWPRDQAVEVA